MRTAEYSPGIGQLADGGAPAGCCARRSAAAGQCDGRRVRPRAAAAGRVGSGRELLRASRTRHHCLIGPEGHGGEVARCHRSTGSAPDRQWQRSMPSFLPHAWRSTDLRRVAGSDGIDRATGDRERCRSSDDIGTSPPWPSGPMRQWWRVRLARSSFPSRPHAPSCTARGRTRRPSHWPAAALRRAQQPPSAPVCQLANPGEYSAVRIETVIPCPKNASNYVNLRVK